MKVITKPDHNFQPVEITLILETPRDAQVLYDLCNHNVIVGKAVEKSTDGKTRAIDINNVFAEPVYQALHAVYGARQVNRLWSAND